MEQGHCLLKEFYEIRSFMHFYMEGSEKTIFDACILAQKKKNVLVMRKLLVTQISCGF